MSSKNITYSVLFLLLLLVTFFIRSFVFLMPHKGSDEIQYMGLAYKIEKHGTASYNLRGLYTTYTIDEKLFEISDVMQENSSYFLYALPPYYDEPLFHKPPGLPFLIMLSHKLFAKVPAYAAGGDILKGKTKKIYGQAVCSAQFYASFICFFFAFLSVIMVFIVGKHLFDTEIGLYGAFLFSICPISIMVSSRLWTDGVALCFMLLGFYFYLLARDKKNMILALFSGVFLAAATLTRTVAFVILPVFFVAEIISFLRVKNNKQNATKYFFGMFFVVLVVAVILSLPWFIALFREYGTPFYFPAKDPSSLAGNNWLKIVAGRSAWLYVINPIVHCPLLILFYYFFIKQLSFLKAEGDKENISFSGTVLLLLFATFLLVFSLLEFKELRYILPSVFVMCVYSGAVLKDIRKYFFKKMGGRQAKIMLLSLLFVCAWWSVSLANYFLDTNSVIIMFPF